ncbi:hypothetical protein D3C87_1331790 [compost metagenome]
MIFLAIANDVDFKQLRSKRHTGRTYAVLTANPFLLVCGEVTTGTKRTKHYFWSVQTSLVFIDWNATTVITNSYMASRW